MKIKAFLVYVAFILLFSSLSSLMSVKAEDSLSNLMISEVQTGGCLAYGELNSTCSQEDVSMEFVELYNPLDTSLIIRDWKVQYITSSGKTVTDLAVLDGEIMPKSFVLLSQENYLALYRDISFSTSLAKSGGHIRISSEAGHTIDLLGWGTASATEGWPKVSEILPGYSVKRILPGDPLYGTGLTYTPSTLPLMPTGGGYIPDSQDEYSEEDEDDAATGDSSDCGGIVLSEILPNPSGSDSGREFIELHNPTNSVINLANCKLQTSSKSTFFTFLSLNLQPGEYKAFYDSDTSLNLANSSGGTVWLLDHQNTELDEVSYPADMDDDVSYAFFDGRWKSTYSSSPNEENILQATKPCPSGQFRNIETNRCNSSILASAALTPCKPGKVRNPETNRCRSVASLSSVLKPCDPDQFRNPLTNRCKKLASANLLKPCRPDQERNPETNRCRKVAADLGTELNEVRDIPAESVADKASWWFAGASMVGAVGYGAFEWRREFLAGLNSLKSKFVGPQS